MPGEGILSIGATVDKTGVDAGLGSIQDGVQATVQTIAVQVEETCARTKAAWNKLSEDVKTSAASVSAGSLKVAEATKAQTAALGDLRRASVLARDASIDEAQSTAILAAAQNKVAATSAAVAVAKKEEAASVAASAEEEALSSNVIIAAFQRAALNVRESCTVIQEKLAETAETGEISAAEIATSFGGMGVAIAAAMAVGFAAHFIDETAKVNVELGHLAVETGIAVTSLAGLREIVKESGVDWEPVSMGIVRMTKNLASSGDQMLQLKMAVAGVGLSLKDLQGLSPEQQLNKIAVAFATTANNGNVANAAIELFGRGGKVLIPVLKEQGAELEANMKRQGELTGVTDKSIAASQEWTQNMAKLTEGFQNFGNFAVENMHYVLAAFDAGGAVLRTVFEGIATGIVALGQEFFALGKTIYDALHFNVTELQGDIQKVIHSGIDAVKDGSHDIAQAWRDNARLWKAPTGAPMAAGAADTGDANSDAGSGNGKSSGAGSGSGSGAGAAGGGQLQQQSSVIDSIRERLQAVGQATQDAAAQLTIMNKMADDAAKSEGASVAAIFKSLDDARAASMKKAADDMAKNDLKIAQDWEKTFAKMSGDFNKNMAKWIMDGGNFGQMMRKSLDSMAQDMMRSLMKMGEKWVAHELLMTLAHMAGLATRKSADAGAAALDNAHLMAELGRYIAVEWAKVTHHAAANTARTASDITAAGASNAAAVGAAAAKAAIDTTVATSSIGAGAAAAGAAVAAASGPAAPVAGPAAAAAYAASMAPYFTMAAFEQGGVVGGVGGGGVPILAHAGERVLSQSQTTNFERLVNQSTSSSVVNHFHDHTNFNAVDGASVEGMYRRNAASGRREMMRQMRLANAI